MCVYYTHMHIYTYILYITGCLCVCVVCYGNSRRIMKISIVKYYGSVGVFLQHLAFTLLRVAQHYHWYYVVICTSY